MITTAMATHAPLHRFRRALTLAIALLAVSVAPAWAQEQMYFAAVDDIKSVLVQKINAETVRIDMSAWYLSEGAVVNALLNKHAEGVPIRLISDRGSIFEIDQHTKNSFYKLADAGVPIRLRYHPTWYPEIAHWKATIFVGQGIVTFGSANYTPFELAPVSDTNYKDETVLFTDDPALLGAFKTKFDVMWNDTTVEPRSRIAGPPYFRNWHDACAAEPACADFYTLYPDPEPMVIDTARLEPDNPLPPEMVWGQGSVFNDRLVKEINAESTFIDFVIYRLTVDNITNALLTKHNAGIPVRLIIEPNEYGNRKWPEFWITHANIDKLWAAGVPVKWRTHDGLTHMKMLVTSAYATNASANLAAAWQRDHNYFVPAATKPTIYTAMKDRFQIMWTASDFTDFVPGPPDTPKLASPADGSTAVPTSASLVWNRAPFATSYDVYLGTSSGSMAKVANVPAALVNDPPLTYSWTPPSALNSGTQYYWKVVALTNATSVKPDLARSSTTWGFVTEGNSGPPTAPTDPFPADGATGVGLTPRLSWSEGTLGTTFDVAFGTTNPPPPAAGGLTTNSYDPGSLAQNTTYYWQVTAVNSSGSAPGPVWSFTTGTLPPEVVLYASDVTMNGAWTTVADGTAANGMALHHPDAGFAQTSAPLAAPAHYFEATFDAAAATRYRVWLRIRAAGNEKFNDSVFVQFSDSVNGTGDPIYRIGTTNAIVDNLWTCSSCQSIDWGWSQHAYWLSDTGEVWFENSGPHTIRVQTREDGVYIDQIVISPIEYVDAAPGTASNDSTIVPKPVAEPPGAPAAPNPSDTATDVSVTPTLTWTASGATSYDVKFGAVNPPPDVSTAQADASYAPGPLNYETTYYWQIVAHNAEGTTTGPIWSFTTGSQPAPAPPDAPNAPDPADSATNVTVTPTLTWSADGATSYDVSFGMTSPPPPVSTGQTVASYAPGTLAYSTTYYWQVVAHNGDGTTAGPVWSFTTAAEPPPPPPPPPEVVLYASDVATLSGGWTTVADTTAAGGLALHHPNGGFSQTSAPLAAPTHYFEATFDAPAGTRYRVWLRIRAADNDKFNDSVYVQFSDSVNSTGTAKYRIGSTEAIVDNLWTCSSCQSIDWGWSQHAYWLSDTGEIWFETSGPHTIRVQTREDGVYVDQIVVSPANYVDAAPGPVSNDTTIVPKPEPEPPATPSSPSPADAATDVSITSELGWTAIGATSYDVRFGTADPPPDVSTGQTSASYAPGTLEYGTTYYWQIVARNSEGTTTGPVWSFTTEPEPVPEPPAAPNSPSPADGATAVAVTPTLSWASDGATTYDVAFGTTSPPPQVSTGQTEASYSPGSLEYSTTYYWQIVAHNTYGTTTGPIWSFTTDAEPPPPPADIVIYASDIAAGALNGAWVHEADPASPDGVRLSTPDNGFAMTDAPAASPTHYFDVTFDAEADVPYTIWLRLRAADNLKWNDAVWVQFSDAQVSGAPVYPIDTTSGLLVNLASDSTGSSLNGWGWHNTAYWLEQATTVTFATTGSHTLRIQVREDGVMLDQIVLSPSTYLSTAPGPIASDSTIVPRA